MGHLKDYAGEELETCILSISRYHKACVGVFILSQSLAFRGPQ